MINRGGDEITFLDHIKVTCRLKLGYSFLAFLAGEKMSSIPIEFELSH